MNINSIFILLTFLAIPFYVFAGDVSHIDNEELKTLIERDVPVIDVRATSEWHETGVIEGSHLMMFYDEKGQYDLNKWLQDLSSITSRDKPVVLICLTGSRSRQLSKYLTKVVGYEEVYNVKRGIADWIKKDNPTVSLK